MTTDEAREFWIAEVNGDEFTMPCAIIDHDADKGIHICSPDEDCYCGQCVPRIHVIEHSAYQALKEENERLRESLQWALNGDTGLSSKHLVATHFNMDAEFYSPCDKGDRRRCIGAIRAISGLEDTLDIMKNKVKWAEQVPLIIEEMKG